VISQAMVDAFFPEGNPIGRRLVVDLRSPITAQVIGVAGDTRVFGQGTDAPALLYMTARQSPTNFMNVVARTAPGAAPFSSLLRQAVQDVDPSIAVDRLLRMEDLSSEAVAPARFQVGLIGTFAIVALLLTVVGLYGMLAYAVAERRREIGIRLALGAKANDVAGLVVRQGARLVAVGVVLGLAGALVARQFVASMLFEISPTDPLVFVLVPVLLLVVALLAVAIPARRAARVDAATALRSN
jgi:putative ABC transport system permease protein